MVDWLVIPDIRPRSDLERAHYQPSGSSARRFRMEIVYAGTSGRTRRPLGGLLTSELDYYGLVEVA